MYLWREHHLEDPGSSLLAMLLLVVLLGLSALFSGSETAFFGLSPYRLRELSDGGHKKAQHVAALLRRPDKLLTTLLVGNTAVNIAFTSLMTVSVLAITANYISDEVGNLFATVLITGLLLVFGEVTPKALATHDAGKFSFRVVRVVQWIDILLKPITCLIDLISSVILKIMGVEAGGFRNSIVTEEIIKTAVTLGEESGTVEEDERTMIYNIFQSTDIRVSDVMIPRQAMTCLDEEDSLRQAALVLDEEGFSRLPIRSIKSGKEVIVGILYAKDLLIPFRYKQYNIPVASVMRAPYFCLPNMKTNKLLAEMRQIGRHLALVQTSMGDIVGLVTLEDLLEEIVGEIMDEHDYDDMMATERGDHA